jgi:hypothetical protein
MFSFRGPCFHSEEIVAAERGSLGRWRGMGYGMGYELRCNGGLLAMLPRRKGNAIGDGCVRPWWDDRLQVGGGRLDTTPACRGHLAATVHGQKMTRNDLVVF